MVVMWRMQQIGQPTSLTLLVIQLALIINLYIGWRFSETYVGIALTLALLMGAVLILGYVWDKKLRMWHEQGVVMVERNPYNMHKLTPKEIVYFTQFWIPFGRKLGGEMAQKAESWAEWCDDQMAKDPVLRANVLELTGEYFQSNAGATVHRSV